MRRIKTALSYLMVVAVALLASCTEADDAAVNTSNTGSLKVLLTDAPFPSDLVAEVNVVIDQVSIKKEADGTEENEDAGWMILSNEESAFNLLDLQNGAVAVLADFDEFPIGTYKEIRLHIVSAQVVLNDATIHDLKIPSGTSSGLKIKINGGLEVRGGNPAALIVDFDVAQSFLVQGNPDKNGKDITGFKFKPVIRATAQDISGTVEGFVSLEQLDAGVVSEAAAVGVPVIVSDGETDYMAISNENGYYAIIGILPGTYTVSAELEGFKTFAAETTVETNATSTVDILLELPLGEIAGTVTIEGTETAIQGATVEVLVEDVVVASTTTDETGAYWVPNLPEGAYVVQISAAGYLGFSQADVAVVDESTTAVDAALAVEPVEETANEEQ